MGNMTTEYESLYRAAWDKMEPPAGKMPGISTGVERVAGTDARVRRALDGEWQTIRQITQISGLSDDGVRRAVKRLCKAGEAVERKNEKIRAAQYRRAG